MIFYFNQTCLLQTSVHFIYTQLLTATLIHSFSLHFSIQTFIHSLYIRCFIFCLVSSVFYLHSLQVSLHFTVSPVFIPVIYRDRHTVHCNRNRTEIIYKIYANINFTFKILFASVFWCVSHHFS